jgi:hypothetical protein
MKVILLKPPTIALTALRAALDVQRMVGPRRLVGACSNGEFRV